MTLPTLQPEVIEALRSAGATEEIIAAAVKASGELGNSPPSRGGRPRKHADKAARHQERSIARLALIFVIANWRALAVYYSFRDWSDRI